MRREPAGRYAKGAERRTKIVEAAIAIIAEQGLHAVTAREVAKRAGVGDSAPSYFFATIDDLIVEAFRSTIGAMVEGLAELEREVRDQVLDRESAIDAYISLVSEGSIARDRLQYEAYLFADQWPALRIAVDEALVALRDVAVALLTASGRADLAWAAPIVMAMSDGFGLHRVASGSDGGFDGLAEGLRALVAALPPGPDPR